MGLSGPFSVWSLEMENMEIRRQRDAERLRRTALLFQFGDHPVFGETHSNVTLAQEGHKICPR